jgi:hypothetical protein
MLKFTITLSIWSLAAIALNGQTGERTSRTEEVEIRQNPRYSAAALAHKSPEESLSEVEAELEASSSSDDPQYLRLLHLPRAAKCALEAGQNDKAQRYSEEALEYLKAHSKLSESGKGNAVFYCNLVLGRLALLKGDILRAEEYLLLSGTTSGSPALSTFGPNMSLARELLKRHRSVTVLKYFEECKGFWHEDDERGQLSLWSTEVQAGRMPVFGSNLFY